MLKTHRGDYFENYIARRWMAMTGKPGNSFFYQRLADRRFPGSQAEVFFNATDALSGQPVALGNAGAPLPPSANEKDATSTFNLNAALKEQLWNLSVAQAAHMSARFPYVSPNPDVMLPARKAAEILFNRRGADVGDAPTRVASLVDGGYFDNSGLGPALRLLEDQAALSDKAARSQPRFAIHISNDQRRNCYDTPEQTGCVQVSDKGLEDLKGPSVWGWLGRPGDAILAVRQQHALQQLNELEGTAKNLGAQSLRWGLPPVQEDPTDQMYTHMEEELRSHNVSSIRQKITLKLVSMGGTLKYFKQFPYLGHPMWSEVALSWTLSPSETKFMDQQACKIRYQIIPTGSLSAIPGSEPKVTPPCPPPNSDTN